MFIIIALLINHLNCINAKSHFIKIIDWIASCLLTKRFKGTILFTNIKLKVHLYGNVIYMSLDLHIYSAENSLYSKFYVSTGIFN